jgi:MFS family permease
MITFIPGILSVACVVFLVKERVNAPNHHLRLWRSIKTLPSSFKLFLFSAGIFGLGNFAHTLLILRATEILTPQYGAAAAAATAVALYTLHNVLYAVFSYPVGVLSERLGKRRLLGLGYLLFAIMCIGFILEPHKLWALVLLFSTAGIYMALIDSMERALAGDLLPDDLRGTGYGVLATVNAVGDFVSSFMVGLLWTAVSPQAGFLYGAVLSLASWVVLNRFRRVLHRA